MIDADIAFAISGNKIRIPITKVLLCTTTGDLTRSKNQRDWAPLNAVLLPPLFTEAVILDMETSIEALLEIFTRGITNRAAGEEKDDVDEDGKYYGEKEK